MSAEKTATADPEPAAGEPAGDTSLRNFVVGLLAVSAVIVVLMFLIESAAG